MQKEKPHSSDTTHNSSNSATTTTTPHTRAVCFQLARFDWEVVSRIETVFLQGSIAVDTATPPTTVLALWFGGSQVEWFEEVLLLLSLIFRTVHNTVTECVKVILRIARYEISPFPISDFDLLCYASGSVIVSQTACLVSASTRCQWKQANGAPAAAAAKTLFLQRLNPYFGSGGPWATPVAILQKQTE